jgi:glycerol 3-phosphatase-2
VKDSRERRVQELSSCASDLVGGHDVIMFDLDGVIYRDHEAIPGAAQHLAEVRRRGVAPAFVTNNASRTPDEVAQRLRGMDIEAAAADVVTSAQAVARLMATELPPGCRVLVAGGPGLVAALEEQGMVPVVGMDDDPVAAVQGFGQTVDWTVLAEVAYAVQAGLPWFASNTDRTVPTARGTAPGNGALVAAVRAAVDVDPVVAGKPEPALFDETIRRVGGTRPLVVGDRLDTDIEGANRVGAHSLLVLTGVSGLADLASARPHERPDFVAPGLEGLLSAHPPIEVDAGSVRCAGWLAEVVDGAVQVRAESAASTATALLRAAVTAAWQHVDATGTVADMAQVEQQRQRMA